MYGLIEDNLSSFLKSTVSYLENSTTPLISYFKLIRGYKNRHGFEEKVWLMGVFTPFSKENFKKCIFEARNTIIRISILGSMESFSET